MDLSRRRLLGRAASSIMLGGATGTALLLPGCESLTQPRRVTLSARELEALVHRAFPIERSLLEVFDASVRTPRLRLLPESNRLGANLEVALRDRFLGTRWSGTVDFDGALAWKADDHSLRLREVRVLDLQFVSSGVASRSMLERLGAVLAERVLEDLQLYKLPAERAAQLQRRGQVPGSVMVTPRGVEITLAPSSG